MQMRGDNIVKWVIFFLILPHLKPNSMGVLWPESALLFNAGRIASALIIIFLFFLEKRIPSFPIWVLGVLQGWILITTYLNGGNVYSAGISMVSVLTVAAATDILSVRPWEFIRGLMLNLELLMYTNFLTVILYYPNGLYRDAVYGNRCYFLGYHNSFFQYALIAICVSWLYVYFTGRKLRSFCLIAVSYASILITWSATSVTVLIMVTLFMFLPSQRLRDWITFPKIFVGTLAADIFITIFRVMDRVSLVAWWIEAVLKKQVTLSGRTYIWDKFYRLFFAHPILGYGAGEHIYIFSSFMGTHNQYFEFLHQGGVIALAIYILFNLAVGKKLVQYRKSRSCYLFLVILAGLYTIFISEALSTPIIYMLLMMAYNVNRFEPGSQPAMRRIRIKI